MGSSPSRLSLNHHPSTATSPSDKLQQASAVRTASADNCYPAERDAWHTPRSNSSHRGKCSVRTQGEDVSASGSGHVVLLDGLVECGLAQQQETEANPRGQQPGHGEAESAGQHTTIRRLQTSVQTYCSKLIWQTHISDIFNNSAMKRSSKR